MNPHFWWNKYPDRLEDELQALRNAGIEFSRDEDAIKQGVYRLSLKVPHESEVLDLEAAFPDLYPYFRFMVTAKDIDLKHHINPFDKNLCLIGRSTANWRPHTDRLADFLINRLPKVLACGKNDNIDEVVDEEELQAEPYTDYFSYNAGTGFIVDGNWSIPPECMGGRLKIALNTRNSALHGAVIEVLNERNRLIASPDNRLAKAFPNGCLLANWVRLQEPPKVNNPAYLFNYFTDKDRRQNNESYSTGNCKIQIRAALFPMEIEHREMGEGWIFVVRKQLTLGQRTKTIKKRYGKNNRK